MESTRVAFLRTGAVKIVWALLFALAIGSVAALSGCAGSSSVPAWVKTEEAKNHPGKNTYRRYCRSCHQGGTAGSPIFGDKEAWEPRIEKGRDALLESTIKGIPPGMPIKGLCGGCTDEELEQAIDYMIKAVEAQELTEEESDQGSDTEPEVEE